jgi:homoserine dehydrogenase
MMLRLVIIGFGNVGQEFARLLLSKREWLRNSRGLIVEVVAVATRTRGSLLLENGLDLERALQELRSRGTLRGYGPEVTDLPPLELIERCEADIMVELTTLNIESGEPALSHVRTALETGVSVVTANKGPVAYAYDDLKALADAHGVHFRFEGTVLDGAPVFSLVERTLPGCNVLGISGVLNSTSNFVLTEMARGRSMDEAVKEAQRRGFAEADPSLDIDGWDAAAKITALANVLMGARSTPRQVDRTGIRGITNESVKAALAESKKIKLVARAERVGGSVRTVVRPELVEPVSPFWTVDGTSSALTLCTDLMGELTIIEANPSLLQTAYAIFSDMLLVAEAVRRGAS